MTEASEGTPPAEKPAVPNEQDKAAAPGAKPKATAKPEKAPVKPKATAKPKGKARDPSAGRRGFVQLSLVAAGLAWTGAMVKFFFPRILFEPATRFPIGFPTDYVIGVDTKWQQAKRIWVVREPSRLYVIFARCTHLGCTPDWKSGENKFKCPCHGSGFDMQGVNFEGPAPQPLLRTQVSLDARGQVVVDKGKLFPVDDWDDSDAFLVV